MEWCWHIRDAAELAGELALPADLALLFGPAQFTRVAFGTEFCEHLLPSAGALRAVLETASRRGLAVTFLTPYVSDAGIAQLRRLFPLLDGEVVFNDWGTMNLLRREFPNLTPVQGRLMNKSLRDPRVTTIYWETAGSAPAASLRVLERSSLDDSHCTELLERFGVRHVEMDNLPQGMDLSFALRGIRISVYVPFGFISTSRVCMAAGLHYHKTDKFQPGAPCRHECQTHMVEYTYTNSPFSNRDQKFLLKGNTYFYAHSEPMLRRLAQQAASGAIARLVYQPGLPMFAAEGRRCSQAPPGPAVEVVS